MKTAGLTLKILLLLLLPIQAAWKISAEADARLRLDDWEDTHVSLHGAGLAVRKTIADSKGDRLTLYVLAEAMENFDEVMLHEIYGLYKGPLGLWNVTAGRFTLQYGLRWNFSSKRLLFEGPDHALFGFDADNGVMVSGIAGRFDYALAVTQGLGPHHDLEWPGPGLVTGRLGVALGETDEQSLGLSLAGAEEKQFAGLDAIFYIGRAIVRFEGSAGKSGDMWLRTAFANLDFALLPRLDLTFAGSFTRHGREDMADGFAGVTVKPKYVTVRGGYTYAYNGKPDHRLSVQLYRLVAASF